MPVLNLSPVTNLYDYQIQEWQNDLSAMQLQIKEDEALLSSYKKEKEESENIGTTIRNEIYKSIIEIEELKDELWEDIEKAWGDLGDTFNEHANKSAEDIFNEIFNPFLEAINPLLDMVGNIGLPEVPIIGNIQSIIQKIAQTGRIISRLPQEVRDAARKEAEEQKKAEKEYKKAMAENKKAQRKLRQEQENMSCWDRVVDDFKNSPFGKLCIEILEIFGEILNVIGLICQCAVLVAVSMILEKIKPIVGLIGDAVALVTNALTVAKMLVFSQMQLLRYFYKLLEEKLSDLWNIVRYVADGGWSLPVNAMISATYADMICCEFEISSITKEMNRISVDHVIDVDKEQIELYGNRIAKLEGEIKSERESPEPNSGKITELQKTRRKLQNKKDLVNYKKELDVATLESVKKGIEAFDADKSNQYDLELKRRTQADLFLQDSHDSIKKSIEDNAKKTKEANEKKEKAQKDLEELKKKHKEEEEAAKAKKAANKPST